MGRSDFGFVSRSFRVTGFLILLAFAFVAENEPRSPVALRSPTVVA